HDRHHAHHPVHGRLRNGHLLRPARPQGSLRPPAPRAPDRRRPTGRRAGARRPARAAVGPTAGIAAAVLAPATPLDADAAGRHGPMKYAATVALALLVVVVFVAGAAAATRGQVRALATRAADDPQALAQLEQITAVDGRPVDLRRALAGAHGPDLRARLDAL